MPVDLRIEYGNVLVVPPRGGWPPGGGRFVAVPVLVCGLCGADDRGPFCEGCCPACAEAEAVPSAPDCQVHLGQPPEELAAIASWTSRLPSRSDG